jgi:transcription-repair coupling factor (superfamily II helicase)
MQCGHTAAMADGTVDIVVGTHALLAKGVTFKKLGLLVIDEEQHFRRHPQGTAEGMRSEVHVLTLTATPIPRTLQLSLTGVRDLSIIATPPVDRLAIRTYVSASSTRSPSARRSCANGSGAGKVSMSCRASPICMRSRIS